MAAAFGGRRFHVSQRHLQQGRFFEIPVTPGDWFSRRRQDSSGMARCPSQSASERTALIVGQGQDEIAQMVSAAVSLALHGAKPVFTQAAETVRFTAVTRNT